MKASGQSESMSYVRKLKALLERKNPVSRLTHSSGNIMTPVRTTSAYRGRSTDSKDQMVAKNFEDQPELKRIWEDANMVRNFPRLDS